MANTEMVEVVIKMPKEKYDIICSTYGTFPAEMKEWGLEYIKDGTLLSKGHGDLVDRDELLVHEKYGIGAVYVEDINDAPTIIEADTQSKEKENIGGAVIERTVTAKITLTPREIAEENWNFNPVEQADLILALTQKFYDKETHGLKRLHDLKEGLKELNEDERCDAIMFLKGVVETLKDADQELKYE
jgi:hypothetical protein